MNEGLKEIGKGLITLANLILVLFLFNTYLQKDSFNNLLNNLQKNQNEINLISSHFKSLGEQVPEALNISLNALNSGLTSLTTKFRNDYKDMIEKNMKEINNGNR